MIITLCGKGGVGKTTISALILDELARLNYPGPVLVVDGDPASTLSMALGLPDPQATIADIRDTLPLDAKIKRSLPPGMSVGDYSLKQIREANVLTHHQLRQMPLDLIVMGQGEGQGCYCSINHALSMALNELVNRYPLVLIDNEAGLEHISRYRLKRADFFLVVTLVDQAAQSVARRIMETAADVKIEIGESWLIFNQAPANFQPAENGYRAIALPRTESITTLGLQGEPVVNIPTGDSMRQALCPILIRIVPLLLE